jgi:hypothetical protein
VFSTQEAFEIAEKVDKVASAARLREIGESDRNVRSASKSGTIMEFGILEMGPSGSESASFWRSRSQNRSELQNSIGNASYPRLPMCLAVPSTASSALDCGNFVVRLTIRMEGLHFMPACER